MITVTIHAVGRGKFLTAMNENPLVASPTSNPMYASRRALVARGCRDGPIQFVHAGSDTVAARIGSIEGGAKLRVEETDKRGLRIVAYRPFEGVAGTYTPDEGETAADDDLSDIAGHV